MDEIVFLTCHLMALCKFRTWCCFVFHTRALLVLSLIKQVSYVSLIKLDKQC